MGTLIACETCPLHPPPTPASCVISHPLLWTCVPSLIRDVGEAEGWKERGKRQSAGLAAALRVWWDHLFSPSHTNTSIKGKQQRRCITRRRYKNTEGNTKTCTETPFVNATQRQHLCKRMTVSLLRKQFCFLSVSFGEQRSLSLPSRKVGGLEDHNWYFMTIPVRRFVVAFRN